MGSSRSLKVTYFGTVRKPLCDFLLVNINSVFEMCICLYITAVCSTTGMWPKEKFLCDGHSGSWIEDKTDYDVSWQSLLNSTDVASGWCYDTASPR